MTISAIVPCFNAAHFLPSCLDSIIRQGHPVTEIIIIDDGSTDNTACVARGYIDRLETFPSHSFKFVRQQNAGVSAARNLGIRHATGDWVAFIDVDDIWYDKHNHILYNLVSREDDCVLAFADSDRVLSRSDGRQFPLPTFFELAGIKDHFSERSGDICPLNGAIFAKLLHSSFIPTNANLVRRSALENIGGFDTSLRYGEDRLFWLRLFTEGTVIGVRETVGLQVIHEENATHPRNNVMMVRDHIKLLNKLLSDPHLQELREMHIPDLSAAFDHYIARFRYTTSAAGISCMLRERSTLRAYSDEYTIKDWIRGCIYSCINSIFR